MYQSDQVCISQFQFLCIKSTNDLRELDGRLGLGRKLAAFTGDNYIDKLFSANIISKKQFSLNLDNEAGSSFIDFGPFDTNQWKYEVPSYIPVEGLAKATNPYWQNSVDGFYFSDHTQKWNTESMLAIIDSSSNLLSGPQTEIDFIIEYIT